MSLAIAERLGRMSPQEFRAFQDGRPDEERWELYDGVPVMMSPALLTHNRIASNLERLLNDALASHDPSRLAQQRPGLELAGSGDYRPEPDLAVMDSDYQPDQRYLTRAYLLAEIASTTDRDSVPGRREAKLDAKRRIYRAHDACEAILSVEQDRMEALVELRTDRGWMERRLSGPDAELALPSFGLRCRLGDLYEHTPIGRGGG